MSAPLRVPNMRHVGANIVGLKVRIWGSGCGCVGDGLVRRGRKRVGSRWVWLWLGCRVHVHNVKGNIGPHVV